MSFVRLISISAALAFSAPAFAHHYTLGDLQIGHPHARPTVAGQSNGAAYIGLENLGKKEDSLVAVSSPAAAGAGVHMTSEENNMMKMREAGPLDIAPGSKITMVPGNGYHIMLTGLKQPLNPGDKFPMTLTFKNAGKIEVSVVVDQFNPSSPAVDGSAANHSH
jgi:copper(I)-binding protein